MSMNRGHSISVENLEVRRITGRRIILKGSCGLSVNILVDDWSKLRTRINRAARIANKQTLSNYEQQEKEYQNTLRNIEEARIRGTINDSSYRL